MASDDPQNVSLALPAGPAASPERLTRFHLTVMFWLGLLLMAEGYDLTAAAYAVPWLAKAWPIQPGDAGPMLSASLFGMMAGAPLLGYFGDRAGRKRLIVLSTGLVCLGSMLSALAPSLTALTVARVLVGIGVGGVLTNSYSLAAEFAPRGRLATMVTIVAGAGAAGGFLPAVVSLWLAPQFGWQVLFVMGAVLPAVALLGVIAFVPESIRFLLSKGRQAEAQDQARRRGLPVAALLDGLTTPSQTAFKGGSLFAGALIWITPLLWLIYCADMMAIYLVASWTPQLLSSASDPAAGVLASSLLNVGGAVGGLTFGMVLDRSGLRSLAPLYGLAAVLVALLGFTHGLSLNLAIFAAGLVVVGLGACLNALASRVYPTDRRSRGIGMLNGIARFGAVLGPLVGGALLHRGFGTDAIYLAAAAPLIAAGLLCLPLVGLILKDETRASAVMR